MEQLRSELLDPLQRGGSGRYRQAVHDLATDQSLDLPYELAPLGVVLLLDGVFLHRDELVDCWDLSVFLEVPFGVSVKRMAARDGTDPNPNSPSTCRHSGTTSGQGAAGPRHDGDRQQRLRATAADASRTCRSRTPSPASHR